MRKDIMRNTPTTYLEITMTNEELVEDFMDRTRSIRAAIDSVGTRVYQHDAAKELAGLASKISWQHKRILELENMCDNHNIPHQE